MHVTFHFYRSAILLSVPGSTTLSNLKTQLLPAFTPFASTLPAPTPSSTADFRLWDDKELVDGADAGEEAIKCLDDDEAGMKKSIQAAGWARWKTVYVRSVDGAMRVLGRG